MNYLNCLGASREVGRSCFALNAGGKTVLLDCGMKTTEDNSKWLLPEFKYAKKPDAVILSHAHLDHSGALPVTQKHGSPHVVMTKSSVPVVDILLDDVVKIAQNEGYALPFSKADFTKLHKRTTTFDYNESFKIGEIDFELIDAGHIIGSSQIQCTFEDQTMLYTGDFKVLPTRMHEGCALPEKQIDTLVIESTYANEEQEDRVKLEKRFCKDVKETIEDGVALIPAFALGRTQEIISILHSAGITGNVYVQGMGTKMNNVYYESPKYIRDIKDFRKALSGVKVIKDREMQKDALQEGNVIICTSGMLDAGPVLHFIEKMQQNDLSGKIFLTGYQVPGTNGDLLLRESKVIQKNRIPQVEIEVSNAFELFEFSAHSGKTELYEYVRKVNPSKVICVHGEDEVTQEFANNLKEEGFNATSPKIGDKIKL